MGAALRAAVGLASGLIRLPGFLCKLAQKSELGSAFSFVLGCGKACNA
jgi:hypothetical protein